MSWTDSHPVEPVVYRWRALAAFIAALALVVGVAAPAALPGIVGAVAEAQTTTLRTKLDSADQLSLTVGDSATFEGHFVDAGTVEELEFTVETAGLEFDGSAYTLTIDGEVIPVREGDNLVVKSTSSSVTFRIAGLSTDVPAGAAFSLKIPAVAEESELSGMSVDVRGVAEETTSTSSPESSEALEAPSEVTEPLDIADVDAAPARLMAAPNITPYAAGDRTITMVNDGYVLKGSRYIPNFKIPAGELFGGQLSIPQGTVVTLKSSVNSYLSTNPDDLTIYYTGANGGWYEAKVTYKRISAKEYQVILPQITIGGTAQIQFKGVHRGPADTVFTASFTVPAKEECQDPVTSRQPKRDLTPAEFADGSPVYVVTSEPKDLRRDTSILSRQVNQGRDFRQVGESTPWVYNALAFDSSDNWLYAVSQIRGQNGDPCYPAGNLLQINPATGEVYNLGPILKAGSTGTPFETSGDRDLLNAGVYTSEGFFVGNTSTSGSRHLYKVDVDKVTAQRVLGSQKSYSEDWAVLPQAQKYMWGFQSKAQAGDKLILERIDTQTGDIRTWDLTGIKTLDGRTISNPSASWGKAWTYSNGNLGFGSGSANANQLGFELKITNPDDDSPKFELVNIMNNLPASFNTDAASDLVPPPPALQSNIAVKKQRSETKVVDGEVRTFWTISVENTTDNASSGGTFWEYLPTDTHYGVNATDPTAKFEGFGPGSTVVNGRGPGPNEIKPESGIYAGMDVPSATSGEVGYMKGYVGTLPGHAKVEYVVSAPVRKDENGNLKTVCSPNKVAFQATDGESSPAEDDNVATEACLNKVAVDNTPQPVLGAVNEYTAKYNVVVEAPDAPGFDTNDVIYGKLTDTPKFVGAATVTGATVVFKDEFNRTSQPQSYLGAGPYELNKNDTPKIIKPKSKGVGGSTGQHVYEVTVRFKLDRSKLDSTSVPAGYPSQPAGNTRCYTKDGLHEPNFGLMNEAEIGGWKDTDCIPLETKETMDVLLEKASYNPDNPDEIQTDGLLGGAQFTVHRGDANGNLKLNADGSVNVDANPVVKQSTTTTTGRVKLEGLDAPGVYYLIETKAPNGYNLLPAPIKFSTEWDQNGNAVIKVLSGGTAITSNRCAESDTAANCVKKIGVLQVADITKGALPKTGGEGVGLWALAGAAIVAAGCLALRRRWV
ncbi:MAG: prealbumin-like fold domain-containing protein [Corynebacterium sp.]|uniref:prealbumin-like fold domain-containing protein n=1 Tax=unclassified Corynebacterium TaxID=2624378 RepID=UPI000B098964|nr:MULTISPECIES: prealbumin-like fold domain-containing protein [unclassified Corynebacterium]MBS5996689.1 LPXTG cell wall anchor domain-containing protein [Corynebacterium sp.]MDU1461192.1 prealbumin-like fold domain-containing protein [Corynebacterium sp.]MDU5017244.1 prealbumin-like fold domain-containing protein [Corynebacterium sp.]